MTRKSFLAVLFTGALALTGCKSNVEVEVVGAKKCCDKKCSCPCECCKACCDHKKCGCTKDAKCCDLCTCACTK